MAKGDCSGSTLGTKASRPEARRSHREQLIQFGCCTALWGQARELAPEMLLFLEDHSGSPCGMKERVETRT